MESEKEGGSKPAGEPTLVNSLCSPRPGAQGSVTESVARVGIAPKVPLSRKEPIPRSSVALGCGSLSPLAPESECVRVHRNASMCPLVYTCIYLYIH